MKLATRRVHLRRFQEQDLPQVSTALETSDAWRTTTPYWKPLSDDELRAHLGIAPREDAYKFAVCLIGEERPVGIADLNRIDLRQGTAEPGVALWSEGTRGARVGRSALWLVCRWGLDSLRLERLSARIISSNTAAIRNTEAIGFVREGLLRNHLLLAGERHDVVLFGAMKEELHDYEPDTLPWE